MLLSGWVWRGVEGGCRGAKGGGWVKGREEGMRKEGGGKMGISLWRIKWGGK